MANSSRIHVTFMAVSWHFHMQALPGNSLPKSIGKVIQKVCVGCRFVFFCLIPASFLAICQIHVGFMALSWHFHGAFFLLIFIVFPNSFMALAWQIHGTFMALSCHFPGTFPFGHVWIWHESAMNLPNLDETYMSDSCLFVSVYFCLFVVSVFF